MATNKGNLKPSARQHTCFEKRSWFKMDQDRHGKRRLSYTMTDVIELGPSFAMPI